MAEACMRFSVEDRRLAARSVAQPCTAHEACLWAAEDLEHDWREHRPNSGMRHKHGPAAEHFTLAVRAGVIEIRVLSDVAYSWHRLVRIRKDKFPTAWGHPIKVADLRAPILADRDPSVGGSSP